MSALDNLAHQEQIRKLNRDVNSYISLVAKISEIAEEMSMYDITQLIDEFNEEME